MRKEKKLIRTILWSELREAPGGQGLSEKQGQLQVRRDLPGA